MERERRRGSGSYIALVGYVLNVGVCFGQAIHVWVFGSV
jgi:divalent metal cation (Fe/Co/Zn/Cd) transporter